jgi:hypothetical protein
MKEAAGSDFILLSLPYSAELFQSLGKWPVFKISREAPSDFSVIIIGDFDIHLKGKCNMLTNLRDVFFSQRLGFVRDITLGFHRITNSVDIHFHESVFRLSYLMLHKLSTER